MSAAPRNPAPTVDVIMQDRDGRVVLIRRRNPPPGWAIPGGFVDYGETVEHAAVREAKEETGLAPCGLRLLGVYSDPRRDPRRHTISIVFSARVEGLPVAGDDAAEARLFSREGIPWAELAFDHARILADFFRQEEGPLPPAAGG